MTERKVYLSMLFYVGVYVEGERLPRTAYSWPVEPVRGASVEGQRVDTGLFAAFKNRSNPARKKVYALFLIWLCW